LNKVDFPTFGFPTSPNIAMFSRSFF